jgi:hypothetical protein
MRTSVIVLNVISLLTSLAMAGLGWIVTMIARIPVPEQQDYRVIGYGVALIAAFLMAPVICVTASTRLARQERRSSVLVALAPRCPGCGSRRLFCVGGDIRAYPLNFGCNFANHQCARSALGQTRRFDDAPITSGLAP